MNPEALLWLDLLDISAVFCFIQLEVLKQYLVSGGGMLVMLGEGGEMKYDTNINFLLEEFGIMVNNGMCIDGQSSWTFGIKQHIFHQQLNRTSIVPYRPRKSSIIID